MAGDKSTKFFKLSLKAQELPEDFLSKAPFTVRGKIAAINNGVPLPLGKAIAAAVKKATQP